MADSVIRVSVLGDASSLAKAFQSSAKEAETWSAKMGRAGKGLTVGLTLPIVAGAGLAVDAAAEEAQQMQVLADVIAKRIPGATKEAIDANEAWVTSIQNTTAVADADIREMEQKFISAGASIEEAQRLTALAFDTAAATGKEATSVGDAFVKGINGQVSGLGRLGIATKNADGSTKSFNDITAELAATMGGTAAAAADTAAGRAEIMKLKMADLTEQIGTILLPILDKLTGWLSQIVDWFTQLSPAAKNTIVVIAGVAAAIGPVLIVGSKLVSAFGAIGKAFKVLSLLMSTNPWLLLIAAVVALVILIITNWDKITAFLKKTWAWITETAGKVWDGIKNAIKAAIDFIVNLFLNWSLPGLIIKHWDKIKEGVRKVGEFIKTTWDGIISFFKGIPGRIADALGGLFDGLKNAFRNAVNWIIGKWNSFRLQIKLPALLGGGTLTINTPNIPKFHAGGVFRASTPGGEGLALLRDRETVLRPGARAGSGSSFEINITAGMGADPHSIARVVVEALQRYERSNGPIPIGVRPA